MSQKTATHQSIMDTYNSISGGGLNYFTKNTPNDPEAQPTRINRHVHNGDQNHRLVEVLGKVAAKIDPGELNQLANVKQGEETKSTNTPVKTIKPPKPLPKTPGEKTVETDRLNANNQLPLQMMKQQKLALKLKLASNSKPPVQKYQSLQEVPMAASKVATALAAARKYKQASPIDKLKEMLSHPAAKEAGELEGALHSGMKSIENFTDSVPDRMEGALGKLVDALKHPAAKGIGAGLAGAGIGTGIEALATGKVRGIGAGAGAASGLTSLTALDPKFRASLMKLIGMEGEGDKPLIDPMENAEKTYQWKADHPEEYNDMLERRKKNQRDEEEGK